MGENRPELLVTGASSLLWRHGLGGTLPGVKCIALGRDFAAPAAMAGNSRVLLHLAYTPDGNDALVRDALTAATAAGCHRVIHSSTGSVYGSTWDGRADESRAPQPATAYASDKLRAEALVHAWAGEAPGRSAVSLRLFFPTLPATGLTAAVADGCTHRMFTRIAAALLSGGEVVLEEQDFFMNPVTPAALAAALRHCLTAKALPPVLNVAGSVDTTLRELVTLMAAKLGTSARICGGSAPARSMLACAAALNGLGDAGDFFPGDARRA